MKRLELGRLTDGKFGLRISRPGFDVTDPAAALIFDTEFAVMSAVLASSFVVPTYTRTITNITPPYGLEGTQTTQFRHTNTWNFPISFGFAPVCRIGYTVNVDGDVKHYDDGRLTVTYTSTPTSVTVNVEHGERGTPEYRASPIHRITVFNVARPTR